MRGHLQVSRDDEMKRQDSGERRPGTASPANDGEEGNGQASNGRKRGDRRCVTAGPSQHGTCESDCKSASARAGLLLRLLGVGYCRGHWPWAGTSRPEMVPPSWTRKLL